MFVFDDLIFFLDFQKVVIEENFEFRVEVVKIVNYKIMFIDLKVLCIFGGMYLSLKIEDMKVYSVCFLENILVFVWDFEKSYLIFVKDE